MGDSNIVNILLNVSTTVTCSYQLMKVTWNFEL